MIVSGGHVWMAYRDPQARVGMRTGSVDPAWAQREHSEWAREQGAESVR